MNSLRNKTSSGGKRRWVAAAVSLMVSMMAAGSSVAQSSDQPLTKATFRLDFPAASSNAMYFLGAERGYWRDAGLDLTLLDGKGSSATLNAVAQKQEDFGNVQLPIVILGVSQGSPVVSVAVMQRQTDYGIVVPSGSPYTQLSDILGTPILAAAQSSDLYVTKAAFTVAGLDPNKIDFKLVDGPSKQQLYRLGQADAMTIPLHLGVPFASQVRESRGIAYADVGFNLMGFTLIVHQDTANKNPDLVKKFLAGAAKSWEAARQDPAAAIDALIKLNPQKNIDRDLSIEQLTLLMKYTDSKATESWPVGCAAEQDWNEAIRIMTDLVGLSAPLPADRSAFWTNGFLPAQCPK